MNHLFSGFPRKMVTTMVIVKLPGILTICEIPSTLTIIFSLPLLTTFDLISLVLEKETW